MARSRYRERRYRGRKEFDSESSVRLGVQCSIVAHDVVKSADDVKSSGTVKKTMPGLHRVKIIRYFFGHADFVALCDCAARVALRCMLSMLPHEKGIAIVVLCSVLSDTHRSILNQILRQSNVALTEGPFSVLVNHTKVLDFDVKRQHFRQVSALAFCNFILRCSLFGIRN